MLILCDKIRPDSAMEKARRASVCVSRARRKGGRCAFRTESALLSLLSRCVIFPIVDGQVRD